MVKIHRGLQWIPGEKRTKRLHFSTKLRIGSVGKQLMKTMRAKKKMKMILTNGFLLRLFLLIVVCQHTAAGECPSQLNFLSQRPWGAATTLSWAEYRTEPKLTRTGLVRENSHREFTSRIATGAVILARVTIELPDLLSEQRYKTRIPARPLSTGEIPSI